MRIKWFWIGSIVVMIGGCESTIVVIKGNKNIISTKEKVEIDSTKFNLNK